MKAYTCETWNSGNGKQHVPQQCNFVSVFVMYVVGSATLHFQCTNRHHQTQGRASILRKITGFYKRDFTLGFFSLESSDNLGIWFTIDAQKEKVWVANRDKPISRTDANLTLDANGKLMIMHSGGDPIVLNSNQATRNSTTTLLGESFDNLTDTLLYGMKLGINLKLGRNWSLYG